MRNRPGPIIAIAFLPALLLAQEPNVSSGKLKIVGREPYEKEAEAAILALENPVDAKALDAYIARYPDSLGAGVAFAVRMSLLRGNPVAADYHRFIETYRDRTGSRLAIADVFVLYRRAHRLSAYLDFMRRYPSSPEASVARLHVHQLAFEFARRLDTAADYDGFVRMFPEAAQREAAEALAEERAVDEERARYEAARKEHGEKAGAWVNRRLRNLVFEYRDLWSAATRPEPTRQVRRFVEENVLGGPFDPDDRAMRYYLARRVARLYAVVRAIEPYRLHEASDQILAEARHQELVEKLDQIRAELAKQEEETRTLLRREFAATRRTIEAGFERVVEEHRRDRKLLVAGFEALAAGLDRLHDDLVAVHGEIRGMRVQMDNIDKGIRQANALLGRLDRRLAVVNESLRRIHVDMNRGFSHVAGSIQAMHRDMNANFDRQAEIALRQLEVAQVSLDVQAQTLYTVDRGFRQVDLTLRTGFTRLEDATWGAASQIARSNRQMAARLSRERTRKAGGGDRALLGAVLGTAATLAGAGPVLGPVVGDMAGQLVTSAASGEPFDPVAIGRTAVVAGAAARFKKIPGANRIAGAMFDRAVDQRRANYVRTADTFAARTGIRRPEQPPWPEVAAGCETAAQFRELERRIAETYRTTPGVIEFCATRVY